MPTTIRADFTSDVTHPSAWLMDWAMGARTKAGVHVTPTGAMALATYYACLRNISEDVAKLPLITYRRLTPRGKERVPTHPAYRLLHDAPNDDMTAMTFREVLTHHVLAWGNAYAEIVWSGTSRPLALYPIHPSRVTLRRDEQGELVYDVYGETVSYGAPTRPGNVVRLRQDDMLHIKGLGCDGYEGYSVLQFAAQSLGVSLAAQDYGASFFGNSSVPSGILKHPGQISNNPEKLEKLRQRWEARRNGTAILEDGMTWEQISIPPEQAQFLETRRFQVEEICRWFRMPPHKIQALENAHYNNVEEMALEYVTDTLMPWLVRWESELRRKLFPDDGAYFAEHLVLGLLRGDMTKRAAYFKARFEMGTISQDEIREIENENPLPNGQGRHYWVAANNYQPLQTILGSDAQPVPAQSQPFVPHLPSRNGHNGHITAMEE